MHSWVTLLPSTDHTLKAAPLVWHLGQRQPAFLCDCGLGEQKGAVKVNKATPVCPLKETSWLLAQTAHGRGGQVASLAGPPLLVLLLGEQVARSVDAQPAGRAH